MNWFYFALVSMFFLVIRSLLEKKTLKINNQIQFLTIFYFFNALLVLPLISKIDFFLSYKELFLIISVGILSVVSIYCSISLIKYFELSFSKPIGSLNSIFVLLLAFFFLDESINMLQILGVMIILVISFLFIKDEAKITKNTIKGLFKSKYGIYLIFAVIFGSVCTILDRIILKTVEPLTFLFLSRYVLLSLFLIIVFTRINGIKEITKSFRSSSFIIFIIALMNIGIVYFYNLALAETVAKTGLVAVIRSSSLVFAVVFGGLLFKEKDILHKIILSLILIFGLYLIII